MIDAGNAACPAAPPCRECQVSPCRSSPSSTHREVTQARRGFAASVPAAITPICSDARKIGWPEKGLAGAGSLRCFVGGMCVPVTVIPRADIIVKIKLRFEIIDMAFFLGHELLEQLPRA